MNLSPQGPASGYFYSRNDIEQSVTQFFDGYGAWAVLHVQEENCRYWPVAATFEYDLEIKTLTIKYHP